VATLTAMIADVRARLDEETTTDLMWSDVNITTWLNEANMRVATELESLEGTDTQNIVASTANYILPADFLRLDQAIYNGLYLHGISREELKRFAGIGQPTTSQTGTPQSCYVRAGDLWLFPAPAAALTAGLVLWYYKTPAALVAGTECEQPTHLHYLLPIYACYLGYMKDNYRIEAQMMKGLFDEGIERARQFMAIGEDRIELGQIFDPGD
jgi:hypothetical protein